MKTLIRLEVLNISLENWNKINKITFNGFQINVTPSELINLIGFDSGQFISGKLNNEEKIFVDKYYKLSKILTK